MTLKVASQYYRISCRVAVRNGVGLSRLHKCDVYKLHNRSETAAGGCACQCDKIELCHRSETAAGKCTHDCDIYESIFKKEAAECGSVQSFV